METPSIDPIEEDRIEVHGLIGKFDTPEKRLTVHYFATKANGSKSGTGEYRLLEELKPMRERVDASGLQNLNSLLQRDLNDARVATELIPYLHGIKSEIAFFPAILGVLIPSGFISSDENEDSYPTAETEEDETKVITYEDKWSLTAYKIGGDYGPLGKLSFSPSKTDVVVLDGQHRSNAFRYICGMLESDSNDIYDAFYHEVDRPEDYSSDLPVTLIWFERNDDEAEVDPKLISRNLFVDVNNSAKKVSKSRNILLDDRKVTSLLTRFFYSDIAAKESFSSGDLSLLHTGFDIDTDLAKRSGHIVTLTNPEIIEYTISWIMLGTDTYNSLDRYLVHQERKRKQVSELGHIFDDPDFNRQDVYIQELTDDVIISGPEKIPDFQNEFENKLSSTIYDLINGFDFVKPHLEASEAISQWRHEKGASTMVREVWDKVFNGGEGLYYSLMFSDLVENPRLEDYRAAVEEIEDRFRRERADRIDAESVERVDRAFTSFRTKAFSVGLFMALKKFGYDEVEPDLGEKWIDMKTKFIDQINSLNASQWVAVFNDIKPRVQSRTDPKKWPTYQKIILRLIQEEGEYYDAANFLDSPDGRIFSSEVKEKLSGYFETNDVELEGFSIEDIPGDRIRAWAQDIKNNVDDLFRDSGIGPLDNVDEIEEARRVIRSRIDELQE